VGRTRRPGPVKRRFATTGPTAEVEYGGGMPAAVEKRRKAHEAAEEIVAELAGRLGIGVDEAAYILLDAVRNMLGKRWRR
jgi:hypothetical protein